MLPPFVSSTMKQSSFILPIVPPENGKRTLLCRKTAFIRSQATHINGRGRNHSFRDPLRFLTVPYHGIMKTDAEHDDKRLYDQFRTFGMDGEAAYIAV